MAKDSDSAKAPRRCGNCEFYRPDKKGLMLCWVKPAWYDEDLAQNTRGEEVEDWWPACKDHQIKRND